MTRAWSWRACVGISISAALAALVPSAYARGVHVNLTAAWPSAAVFPLLEASEFVADENAPLFWRYLDELATHRDAIAAAGQDIEALTTLAVDAAQLVAPNTRNILELSLATRTYSVKIEMFRQLALDSLAHVCGSSADAWAVVSNAEQCATAVACSAAELDAALGSLDAADATCISVGANDVALAVDHRYPQHTTPERGTVILYGQLGSKAFDAFHTKLVPLAKDMQIGYIVRPFAKDSNLETLLQGYGVSLDIRNMEYKVIDDSKSSGDNAQSENGTEDDATADDDDENDEDGEEDDEDVDGLYFAKLVQSYDAIKVEIETFRDALVKEHAQDETIKAWHLQDMGIAAARSILDAKNPLKRLRALSQDFPRHAKKLAFSRKPLSEDFRKEITLRRSEVEQRGLLNRFLLNGIAVDPMDIMFNVFDFMTTLKDEWSFAKKVAALPLRAEDREAMLGQVLEGIEEGQQGAVRVRVKGPVDGTAPLYLNNIETDPVTAGWPSDVRTLARPAWNLIFVRKNMYEYVVAFDPFSPRGKPVLDNINFLRMRNAPLHWGLLISTKELVAARSAEERLELVSQYKSLARENAATAWHFAKLLLLIKHKEEDAQAADGDYQANSITRFIERIAHDDDEMTIETLLKWFAYAVGDTDEVDHVDEGWALLRGSRFDEEVMSMTEFISRKHLPFQSAWFNGILKSDLDLQNEIMSLFGTDQALYQAMARNGDLDDDMDLVEELLASQKAVPSYFSLFESGKEEANSESAASPSRHLYEQDTDGTLEALINTQVTYLHGFKSIATPKKQTMLFVANLSEPVHAAHALEGVRAVQESLGSKIRVGVVHVLGGGRGADTVGELVAAVLDAVGNTDSDAHVMLVAEALRCVIKGKTLSAAKQKLLGVLERVPSWHTDASLRQINSLLESDDQDKLLSEQATRSLWSLNGAIRNAHPSKSDATALLFLNGVPMDLPDSAITDEDIAAISAFDLRRRSQAVAKAFIKRSTKYTAKEASERSNDIVKACAIVDKFLHTTRVSPLSYNDTSNTISLPGDESLHVHAYVDPLSEAAQRMSSLLIMLHSQLNASVDVVLTPLSDYSEFPLQRFYRYLFDNKPPRLANVQFKRLPIKPILTMKIDSPEAWNVQIHRSAEDLDNLRVDPDSPADVRAVKTASFRMESLLVYGQCTDKTFDMFRPPNGLQLVLERDIGETHFHRDTLVMKNLGYFQLQATPGVWTLHLARGRATDLFEIMDEKTLATIPSMRMVVAGFGSRIEQMLVKKRAGKEMEQLLEPEEADDDDDVEPIAKDAGLIGSYWNSMMSFLGKKKTTSAQANASAPANQVAQTNAAQNRTGETIHVFSLATGHLYERFIKIMMLSVLKRTNNPVTFWLLENFLSPKFKESIPALRAKFGMDIRLVTYKWPNWLRQQTQKQRIIWGYKILFLDVLFPLGVQKIIYVDADQVVRADLKELWDMDLQGAPYGYTPFCDSRNLGFQFWRQGYWKDHLQGRPYHISALYVVDLALFRRMAAGDTLRAVYAQLSADPNSLSNLDQDLPNFAQHDIPIFSLPQEWLWCESWCSDESKGQAKTIDLCNNPKHKEPKLDMAKRVISGEHFKESWIELDQEIHDAELAFVKEVSASESK